MDCRQGILLAFYKGKQSILNSPKTHKIIHTDKANCSWTGELATRAIETCRALRAGFWSYGNGHACGFSPRRAVQKVDSGGLRQRNLGVCAKTCFSLKISCWSLHTCARQGRARQSGVLSTGWTGYQETGVAHNIHQAGAKVGVLFGVRWTGGISPAAQPPVGGTVVEIEIRPISRKN